MPQSYTHGICAGIFSDHDFMSRKKEEENKRENKWIKHCWSQQDVSPQLSFVGEVGLNLGTCLA